jgi:hypothetical protein
MNLLQQTTWLPWLSRNINNPNTRFSKAHTTLNLSNFKIIEAMGLKMVPLNGITSVPNYMKICQVVQKLLVGEQTDRQVI